MAADVILRPSVRMEQGTAVSHISKGRNSSCGGCRCVNCCFCCCPLLVACCVLLAERAAVTRLGLFGRFCNGAVWSVTCYLVQNIQYVADTLFQGRLATPCCAVLLVAACWFLPRCAMIAVCTLLLAACCCWLLLAVAGCCFCCWSRCLAAAAF